MASDRGAAGHQGVDDAFVSQVAQLEQVRPTLPFYHFGRLQSRCRQQTLEEALAQPAEFETSLQALSRQCQVSLKFLQNHKLLPGIYRNIEYYLLLPRKAKYIEA